MFMRCLKGTKHLKIPFVQTFTDPSQMHNNVSVNVNLVEPQFKIYGWNMIIKNLRTHLEG